VTAQYSYSLFKLFKLINYLLNHSANRNTFTQHHTPQMNRGSEGHWQILHRHKYLNLNPLLSQYYTTKLRLRLSSSGSVQNIGRQVVSIWHDRWQYLLRRSSQHPVCPNLLSGCLAMSSLVSDPPPAIFWYPF